MCKSKPLWKCRLGSVVTVSLAICRVSCDLQSTSSFLILLNAILTATLASVMSTHSSKLLSPLEDSGLENNQGINCGCRKTVSGGSCSKFTGSLVHSWVPCQRVFWKPSLMFTISPSTCPAFSYILEWIYTYFNSMSLVSEQWLRSHIELDMSPDSAFSCMISGKVFNLSGSWFTQL